MNYTVYSDKISFLILSNPFDPIYEVREKSEHFLNSIQNSSESNFHFMILKLLLKLNENSWSKLEFLYLNLDF